MLQDPHPARPPLSRLAFQLKAWSSASLSPPGLKLRNWDRGQLRFAFLQGKGGPAVETGLAEGIAGRKAKEHGDVRVAMTSSPNVIPASFTSFKANGFFKMGYVIY